MSEHKVSVALPLDRDGFLRRECPTCEREFKWRYGDESEDEHVTEPPPGGYFCPYCAVQAADDAWWTKPQLEHMQVIGAREFMGPMLNEIGRSLGAGNVKADLPDEPDPLQEQDDMRRVEFTCHPAEPVKVLDEWDQPAHCLLCGQAAN